MMIEMFRELLRKVLHIFCFHINQFEMHGKIGDLQKSKKRLFSDQLNITSILETIPLRR
jgi:hypothetical protein